MDRSHVRHPGEDFGAEERAPRRRGIILTVVGALLMILAVLDGWPMG
jgi:hypothetical protein